MKISHSQSAEKCPFEQNLQKDCEKEPQGLAKAHLSHTSVLHIHDTHRQRIKDSPFLCTFKFVVLAHD